MRFFEDIERFRGTEPVNEQGQTLEEFLDDYDARKYDCPSNTVDMLVFKSEGAYTTWGQPLKLLMIRRRNHPSIGDFALPGGFVEIREDLETAAKRELQEETGVTDLPLIQLGAFGAPDRDPRWRIITTAYMTLIEKEIPVQAGDDAKDAMWLDAKLSQQDDLLRVDLTNEEKGVHLFTTARLESHKVSVLTKETFSMVENSGIASDHGVLIVEALYQIRKASE